MAGLLQTWKTDLGEAIWTGVRNVVVNVVAAPFRAIGRLFKGSDDKIEALRVEPPRRCRRRTSSWRSSARARRCRPSA